MAIGPRTTAVLITAITTARHACQPSYLCIRPGGAGWRGGRLTRGGRTGPPPIAMKPPLPSPPLPAAKDCGCAEM